jgi:hypothetical protein
MFDPGALGTLMIGLEANRRREQLAVETGNHTSRTARRGAIRAAMVAVKRRVAAAFAPTATRQVNSSVRRPRGGDTASWVRSRYLHQSSPSE